jgi:outer membrane protein TolC
MMVGRRTAKTELIRLKNSCFLLRLAGVFIVNLALSAPLAAHSTDSVPPPPLDMNLLSQGRSAFPLVWNAYQQASLPPVNSSNGPTFLTYVKEGKLVLPLSGFLQLVVENNLTFEADRYNYLIAQVDLLRARSGQAARGVPSVPVPGALFAGAIGAGVGNTANVSPGGTGGTAISAGPRSIIIGPRGTFDPTISMNISWDRVVNPLNTTKVAGVSTVTVPSAVIQTRWQQELPFGTSYSVSFNMQRQTTTQAHLLYNPAFTSYFSLAVYHPLLNGSGSAFNRRFITLAENDRRIAYQSSHTSLNNVLSSAASSYWDFVALRETERVAENALGLAERTYEATRQRIDVGSLPSGELVGAASQVAGARRDLIRAQKNRLLQEMTLKSLITKVIGSDIAAMSLEPADALASEIDVPVPPLEDALRSAMRRSSIRQAELELENNKIAETFTRSNLRPTLSIFGYVNNYTLAPGAGEMFRQVVANTYPEYSFGLTLAFPIKNRAAQADDVRARLELQQAQVALEQTKANVDIQVRTALTNLIQSRTQVEASQRAVATSQQTADAEQIKWSFGSSTLENVYQTQADLVRSQIAEIQARVAYAKAVIAQEVAVGNFVESHNIVFENALKGSLWN